MTTTTHSPFEGFDELLRGPLEKTDPRSFGIILKLLDTAHGRSGSPFSFLIEMLSGIVISPREARDHWKKILEHKRRLELKLSRAVGIRTAIIDYYDLMGVDAPVSPQAGDRGPRAGRSLTQAITRAPEARPAGKSGDEAMPEHIATPGFYQERLKEELLRSRRYKHALSVMFFSVDLQSADGPFAEKVRAIIVKMINKAVRTVDILGRHSDNTFLLMLPNTNKREALELAGRLKKNISDRTSRITGLSTAVPITIVLGQCSKNDTAADFIKRLEHLAAASGHTMPASIAVLEQPFA